jgi:hypothetical protein
MDPPWYSATSYFSRPEALTRWAGHDTDVIQKVGATKKSARKLFTVYIERASLSIRFW